MSIYKTKKSPYWQYDFVIKGIRFHGSTGTADKAKARTIESKIRTEAAEGRHLNRKPNMSLNQAAERHYQEVGQHKASADDIDYQLDNLVNGLGGAKVLADLTDNDIALYVARRRAGLANASVNREIELLRRVFRRADKVWGADIGEMPQWSMHLLPEPDERVRALSRDEESRLFQHLRDDFKPLIQFCMLTGVRLMNALRLTWAQVDDHAGVIVFKIKSAKPGGERHEVPITTAMATLLSAQKGQHPIYVFTYVCRKSRAKRRKGERYPFSKNGWRKAWKSALEAAGVDDFRFHDLRHTAATRTLRTCGNLKVVQKMLGHSDIATTARYAHVMTEDVRLAMEATQSRNNPELAPRETVNTLGKKA